MQVILRDNSTVDARTWLPVRFLETLFLEVMYSISGIFGPRCAGFHRARSDSQLPHLAAIGSQSSSSESEEAKPLVVAGDLEEVLRQSMPRSPPAPAHRNSFAEGEQRTTFRDSHTAQQAVSQLVQQRVRSSSFMSFTGWQGMCGSIMHCLLRHAPGNLLSCTAS